MIRDAVRVNRARRWVRAFVPRIQLTSFANVRATAQERRDVVQARQLRGARAGADDTVYLQTFKQLWRIKTGP